MFSLQGQILEEVCVRLKRANRFPIEQILAEGHMHAHVASVGSSHMERVDMNAQQKPSMTRVAADESISYTVCVASNFDIMIQDRVRGSGFSCVSEYIRDLLRADLQRSLLEDLDSYLSPGGCEEAPIMSASRQET